MINFKYKKIACQVPDPTAVTTQVQGRVHTYAKHNLVPLKVVFNSGSFHEGDSVYVRSDMLSHVWAKESFVLQGKTFILVPEETIMAIEYDESKTAPEWWHPDVAWNDDHKPGSAF